MADHEDLFAGAREEATPRALLAKNILFLRLLKDLTNHRKELAEILLLWLDCAHDEGVPPEVINQNIFRAMREGLSGQSLNLECPAKLLGREACVNYRDRALARQSARVVTVVIPPTGPPPMN